MNELRRTQQIIPAGRTALFAGLLAIAAIALAPAALGEPAKSLPKAKPPAAATPGADAARGAGRDPVATLKSLEGNVLVSDDEGLSSAQPRRRMPQGARVITTARSSAVVEFDDGCEVRLAENRRLEIDNREPCEKRIALASSLLGQPAGVALAGATASGGSLAAAALAGALPATVPLAGATGIAGLTALVASREENVASPN